MRQVNRLEPGLVGDFSAPLIDRLRPIRFTLDGMLIEAFAGDTVLSALLANGIVSAGTQAGFPVALDAESPPPVVVEGSAAEMPMALCPVANGLKLRTVGAKTKAAPLRRIFSRGPRGLGHDLDVRRAPGNWIDAEADETLYADYLVVGGGLAGMSAAIAAAGRNARVLLIERAPALGGVAAFYGKAEGETPPEDAIARLAGQIAERPEVRVLTGAQAFDISDGLVSVVQVVEANGMPRPRRLAVRFGKAVLATGMDERLPIFSGNRLPGVVGAVSAWLMARQFGVWLGKSFHLHTGTNAGYRMAILGAEAGKIVARASDPRLAPRTRFIEFCKAYGFRLGWGARIAGVAPDRDGLRVQLADQHFTGTKIEPILADTLIVSGGAQPALALWTRAGGAVRWDADNHRLVADGALPDLALAGSAAGFTSIRACIESGKAAIAALKGNSPREIIDPQIEEIYESRDGGLIISRPDQRGLPPAWLGPSRRAALKEPSRKGIAALVLRRPSDRVAELRAADLSDVVGLIMSGQLPADQANGYCQQWCIVPRAFKGAELPVSHLHATGDVPDYLIGRFGLGQSRRRITLNVSRIFDPGCPIFINTDETNPLSAIGVILSSDDHGGVALMARSEFGEGDTVYIRDGAACAPARLGKTL